MYTRTRINYRRCCHIKRQILGKIRMDKNAHVQVLKGSSVLKLITKSLLLVLKNTVSFKK